jgi:hypothetical protein
MFCPRQSGRRYQVQAIAQLLAAAWLQDQSLVLATRVAAVDVFQTGVNEQLFACAVLLAHNHINLGSP